MKTIESKEIQFKDDLEKSEVSDFSRLHTLEEFLTKDMIQELRENFYNTHIESDFRMLKYHSILDNKRKSKKKTWIPYSKQEYEKIVREHKKEIDEEERLMIHQLRIDKNAALSAERRLKRTQKIESVKSQIKNVLSSKNIEDFKSEFHKLFDLFIKNNET